MLLLLFLCALGAVSPSEEQPLQLESGYCDAFWFSFNGRCYRYVATPMAWADAELHCVSMGTNLVSIHSSEEQEFVKSLIKSIDPTEGWTWIGLSDNYKEGHWMWTDGLAVNFTIWSEGQPDDAGGVEDCVHEYKTTEIKWNDLECTKPLPFVCASRVLCPMK